MNSITEYEKELGEAVPYLMDCFHAKWKLRMLIEILEEAKEPGWEKNVTEIQVMVDWLNEFMKDGGIERQHLEDNKAYWSWLFGHLETGWEDPAYGDFYVNDSSNLSIDCPCKNTTTIKGGYTVNCDCFSSYV